MTVPTFPLADIHGQWELSFEHPHISPAQSKRFLDSAFERDYEANGPSLFRICETTFRRWMRFRNHPDPRIRERFEREAGSLAGYVALLHAMERRLPAESAVAARVRTLRRDIERERGLAARVASHVGGRLLAWTSARERRRLERGITYEPPTFVERMRWA